ncbi:ParA family protein [Agromyces sp. S2-1-8]|uniref:MinD/ParA family ATP-binding protein n=1 Tax=Agromyces sp. S2-1-8 TaxID=2897180 RepID=UPI001E290B8D|nr:ParA family protein [Agromyces sp. S2-1-8]MCD5348410.1 ParA family protein [Agromyces sp. S2-1-8]
MAALSPAAASAEVTVFVTTPTRANVHMEGSVIQLEATDPVALREQIVAVLLEHASKNAMTVTAALIDDASDLVLTVGPDGTVVEGPRAVSRPFEQAGPANSELSGFHRAAMRVNDTAPAPDEVLKLATEAARHRPTVDDLLATRPRERVVRAQQGWQGAVRRLTRGVISPTPGSAELLRNSQIGRVRKRLDGARTVVILNPKGGAHKTTSALLLAATFGRLRGGSTLAWDNNETRGTLGWRAQHVPHHRTAVDLLSEIERFEVPANASLAGLDDFVRAQIDAKFDILASDEDAAATSTIDGVAFRRLHRMLARYYRLIIIDTGNNMRASNWIAAVDAADQLVIVSTVREDTAASAAWLLDGLAEKGFSEKVEQAVTVLTSPASRRDQELEQRLEAHFSQLTAAVTHVPYEPALVEGGTIDFGALSEGTHAAWLRAAALVADQL